MNQLRDYISSSSLFFGTFVPRASDFLNQPMATSQRDMRDIHQLKKFDSKLLALLSKGFLFLTKLELIEIDDLQKYYHKIRKNRHNTYLKRKKEMIIILMGETGN